MIKFHFINLQGEGAVVLGYRKTDPVMECMVVRLRHLRERDEQGLLGIVFEPSTQQTFFLNKILCQRKHPSSPWSQNWMAYLHRYVEMIELTSLKGIMDDDQYREFEKVWRSTVKTTPSKSVESTLYGPVDRKREV